MLAHLPALLAALQAVSGSPETAREQHVITIPRIEAEVRVDGRLDEPAWEQAARLTNFRQFQPVDGREAEESTEVLVWYSPQAIHFGIRAGVRDPRAIRATLADRDNIGSDDRVTIYLDTFDDRRRAFFFVVNPLGVQADGVRTEGAVSAGSMFGGSVDFSPDFRFESRGAVADDGYVVELRIPFTSLRYPRGEPQRWGLQIVRDNPASGYEDTWTDVRRAGASFLAQSGAIEGLYGMQRGVVVEAQPFVTASSGGARDFLTQRFERGGIEADAGVNLRLGFTQLSLDATINPDFSQVESDAGLVTVNERFPLFIPEKRPFFLEGIELFATPNNLVYTRRIAEPIAGGKITGKVGPWSVALLSALDDGGDGSFPAPGGASVPDAMVNIARVRRDLAGSSAAGLVFTDRREGGQYNRVAAADARVVFRELYYVEAQLGGSWTRRLASTAPIGTIEFDPVESGALWKVEADRTGRRFGFNYQLQSFSPEFETFSGFVPRRGIVAAHAFNRFSWYGERGALLENFTTFFGPSRIWPHAGALGEDAIEGEDEISGSFRLRGGWEVELSAERGFIRLPDDAYALYEVADGGGTRPYDAPDEISGLYVFSAEVDTPLWPRAAASASIRHGGVPIFAEGSEGRQTQLEASFQLRPLAGLRTQLDAVFVRIVRERDGSEFARTVIPRLVAEYQLTRAVGFRVVSEYVAERRAALADARTGEPLLIGGQPQSGGEFGGLRTDWLAAYEPVPGTVAYLGYGTRHASVQAGFPDDLRRAADGFFVKLAYQFRR